MKSTVRISLLLIAFLIPVLASAQVQTQIVSPPGPFTFSAQQQFFGGTSFMPGGGMFGGMPGGIGMGGFGIAGIAMNIIFIINTVLVPLLFAISFIVFLYGIAQAYIFSTGDAEKVKDGHKIILWGLVGFAIMVSVWGLVNVVAVTFGLTGGFALPPPTSFSPFMMMPPLPVPSSSISI